MGKIQFKFLGLLIGWCLLLFGVGCSFSKNSTRSQKPFVSLAIWSNYLPSELIQEFERSTGIQVKITHFSSNEELLAKLQTGSSEYDVIVPSDYTVFALIHLGLLSELDYQLIKNSKSLDPRFLRKSYDPENRYALPYDWGTTGIAINRDLYPGKIQSWRDLFENSDLNGKLSLLDDSREVIGAALKASGHRLNSVSPEELRLAKNLLLKVKSRLKALTSEPLIPLLNGEVAVAQIFMSDALQARATRGNAIEYFVPKEGGTLWLDYLAIPARAKHSVEAHRLIDFLLEPRVNAETVKRVWVGPANREAVRLLPLDLQKHPQLFPPESFWASLEMVQDLGSSTLLWDRLWTEFKAN